MIVFIPPFTSPRSISSCPTFYPRPTSIYYFISTPSPLWADPEMDVLPLSNYQCTHARAGCTSDPTTVAVRRRPWRVITLVPERFSSKKATSIYHFTLGPCKGCSLFMIYTEVNCMYNQSRSLLSSIPIKPISPIGCILLKTSFSSSHLENLKLPPNLV